MSKAGTKEAPWEYASLDWIHRARQAHYVEEKGRPLTEIKPRLSPQAAAVARRLRLKRVRASDLSRGRRTAG